MEVCDQPRLFLGLLLKLRWSYLQIVTGTSPSTRGKLPTPDIPRDCPTEIWDLIQQCLVLKPGDRPSAKQVPDSCSTCV